MEVITFESEAYKKLFEDLDLKLSSIVKETVQRVLDQQQNSQQWISTEEAMKLLQIKSKTTLGGYRKKNEIMYSLYGGTIVYWKESLLNFIKEHSNEVR